MKQEIIQKRKVSISLSSKSKKLQIDEDIINKYCLDKFKETDNDFFKLDSFFNNLLLNLSKPNNYIFDIEYLKLKIPFNKSNKSSLIINKIFVEIENFTQFLTENHNEFENEIIILDFSIPIFNSKENIKRTIKKEYRKVAKNNPIDWHNTKFEFLIFNENNYDNYQKLLFDSIKRNKKTIEFIFGKRGINFFRNLNKNCDSCHDNVIFYDCNYPQTKEGYDIIELDVDIYKYVKSKK
jgi:hypothetical protein